MIKFTKMQGLGNDYVYIDCTKMQEKEIDNIASLAKIMSNRHFGIGSDGLILICRSEKADFKMKMFNLDGTEAEMCGNGIRCVGKFVYDKGLTKKINLTVETLAGIKELDLHIKDNKVYKVTVNMGKPIFEPDKIPVVSDERIVKNLKLKALDKEFIFTCVSMGNPHAITVVDDNKNFDVKKYGEVLEVATVFPNKTNVEFIEIVDKEHIKMRVWERGTGETLACGTGACATAVACNLNGLTNRHTYVELLRWNFRNRMEQRRQSYLFNWTSSNCI